MNKTYVNELLIGMQRRGVHGEADKLDGIDIEKEYELILQKTCKLSRMKRDMIVDRHDRMIQLYLAYARKRDAEKKKLADERKAEEAEMKVSTDAT